MMMSIDAIRLLTIDSLEFIELRCHDVLDDLVSRVEHHPVKRANGVAGEPLLMAMSALECQAS